MTHDDLRLLLGDHAAGTLEEARRRAVEEHLPGCADCRAWLGAWRAAAAEAADAGPHPEADVLSRLSLAPESLSEDAWSSAERHVAACVPCARHVASLRAAAADADLAPTRRPGISPRALAMAACVAVALPGAVYLAQALRRGPEASGSVPVTWVGAVERSASIPRIRRHGPVAHLAVPLPAGTPADGARVEILQGSGPPAWAADVPAAALRESLAGPGFLLLAVPAGGLSAGEARLVVRSGGRTILERELLVEGPP